MIYVGRRCSRKVGCVNTGNGKVFSIAIAVLALGATSVAAQTLEGIFNTGPSLEEDAKGASLNIRFHPCESNNALSCATVVEVIEPEGPTGASVLPDGSPIIGYTMITGLKAKGDGKFRRGKIAALDESMTKGKMIWYGLRIDDREDGTVVATGCLGIFCPRKMIWTEVSEEGIAEKSILEVDVPDAEPATNSANP